MFAIYASERGGGAMRWVIVSSFFSVIKLASAPARLRASIGPWFWPRAGG